MAKYQVKIQGALVVDLYFNETVEAENYDEAKRNALEIFEFDPSVYEVDNNMRVYNMDIELLEGQDD